MKLIIFFKYEKPDYVIHAAGRSFSYPMMLKYPDILMNEHLNIQNNVLDMCFKHNIKRLLFINNSCVYLNECKQPFSEDDLFKGGIDENIRAYALVKLCGMEKCKIYSENYEKKFLSILPSNQYGPNVKFDPNELLVIPSLMRKFHLAKLVRENKQKEIKKDIQWYGDLDNNTRYELSLNQNYNIINNNPVVTVLGSGYAERDFMNVYNFSEIIYTLIF